MRSTRIFAALIGLSAILAGCAQPYRASVDRRLAEPLGSIESLVIETANGSVTLETDPTLNEIAIDAKVTGSGASTEEAEMRAAAATVQVELTNGGRAARLFVTFPVERRSMEGCALSLRVPRLFQTRIETGNGDVRVSGTSGDLSIDTSNGSVVVDRHDGTLAIDTSNGNLRFTSISGEVIAKSSNGSIELDVGMGSLSRFDLDTSNGGVEVAVGPGYFGTIDAETSNGSVDCRIAGAEVSGYRSEKLVRVGDGVRSRVRTSNGSIVLR